tara:strand:+ start:1802 stop:2017 length:216 start_codon:yes stop_codon:yes gene_type:complete
MKIIFLKEQYIELCVGFDEAEEPIMEEEKISNGEVFNDVEIIDTLNEGIIQVQFGDGSVSFINKDGIEISE